MLYGDYLLKVLKGECPFCNINKNYIVEKGKYFTVILARSPYSKDHLLIVPNRHLVRLSEISRDEQETLLPMITKWIGKLEKIHKEVNVLLRDGVANGVIGKSIDHLHIHLVPDRPVHSGTGGPGRKIFSDYMLTKKTAEFKRIVEGK